MLNLLFLHLQNKEKRKMENEERIKIELEQTKKNLSENLNKLPNEELPFMEPHLRSIYYQSYFLLAYGFYNASIILCGILLESITKERLFNEGVTDKELEGMYFASAINECERREILSLEEIIFLRDKKDKVRNPYVHYNQIKLTEGKFVVSWKIKDPVKKLLALGERVKTGEITEEQARKELIKGIEPELIDSTSLRPVAQTVKGEEDKENAFFIFEEVDKFVRKFAEKYFKTS
jgi:hypothetical protein